MKLLLNQKIDPGILVILLATPVLFVSSCAGDSESIKALSGIIEIPQDVPTIQGGINAALNGSTIMISSGMYQENIVIVGKTITITSKNYSSGLVEDIDQTVIDGGGQTVITVGPQCDNTIIQGMTIQNGNDGISVESVVEIVGNHIVHNVDGVDYESGGGTLSDNLFSNNRDDGIDLDGPTEVLITGNTIVDNDDDGIEIRLHPYSGENLDIYIKDNMICRNQEDGIQLIDYDNVSGRTIHISGNLICENAMAGLGCMADGNTVEDFSGASVLEPVFLINNTFFGNDYCITGGANLAAVNNILADTTHAALKNLTANSIAAYNLFWNNTTDHENSILDPAFSNIFNEDPNLDDDYLPMPGSPAIDAGTSFFQWQDQTVLEIPESSYSGSAPDIGFSEAY